MGTAQAAGSLVEAVAARDRCTSRHSERVCDLAMLLASGVAPVEAGGTQMRLGFLLHDVGKLEIPEAILGKPGPLTAEEMTVMREHPRLGAEMLGHDMSCDLAIDVVLHHHERWDGGGYPARLAGEAIPLWARIFAVADTVDAITSDRPYRSARPLGDALDVLRAEAGRQFDPACVSAFLALDPVRVAALLEGAG